ncbi:MAG: glycosyltransferase family 4 protein [Calditrichaeota bacterium]|nr:glycosyltransferase family 4 protein [Calditrichota bacterium]
MKILIPTAWYPSPDHPSDGLFIRKYAELSARRHNTVVLALYVERDDGNRPELHRMDEGGIVVYRHYQSRGLAPRFRFLTRLWRQYRAGLEVGAREGPFDLIHAHTYQAGLVGALLARKWCVPLAITEHWSGFGSGELTSAERLKARLAFHHADACIVVSEHLRRDIRDSGIASDFMVIPNPVDTDLFRPADFKPNLGGRNSLRLLAVGSLIPRKEYPTLFEAMNRVRDHGIELCLELVGDGPLREILSKLVGRLSLGDAVRFHGFLPPLEIARLTREVDFFVHPARHETFCIATAEALAVGLPVIASDLPAIRDYMDESCGIFVPPGDAAALADAIERMVRSIDEYDPHALAERIRLRFSPEVIADRLEEVYGRLLHQSI